MNAGDNRLGLDLCTSLLAMLDRVEKQTEARALVVTSGHDRIWSNGFDTDWIGARLAQGETQVIMDFLARDIELRRRLLLYPLTTISAINGHVFGGGAVLSLCFDFRLMRSDRGYFCIPLVDRGFPIFPGTAALLRQALPVHMVEAIVLGGLRYTAAECTTNGIIMAAYDKAELMERATGFGRFVGKDRQTMAEIKQVLNGDIARLMERDIELIEPGKIRA
jgi:Delta3-Delta2-enoyl-CoA isomerase